MSRYGRTGAAALTPLQTPRTGDAHTSSGVVLDVETRVDPCALNSSGRRSAPRGMPRGLLTVIAGAVMRFETDAQGLCRSMSLWSGDAAAGERALVRTLDGELARLSDDGTLVTFNGGHDLSALRFAALRLREFSAGGAHAWLKDGRYRRNDLMRDLGDRPDHWPKLSDVSAALGAWSSGEAAFGLSPQGSARAKAEVDVCLTMILHLHMASERVRSAEPLLAGLPLLRDVIEERVEAGAGHLHLLLRAPLLAGAVRY